VSFATDFATFPGEALARRSRGFALAEVRTALERSRLSLRDFAALISPAGGELLEELCQRARRLTQQRFGRVIRLFAPLYLSNECINNCQYCGFSRDNPILRVTLSLDDVRTEARALLGQGFRNILLVSGEHPKFV
jgi:2-iminoacetate synthase